jgi:hypothetical protein
MEIEKLKQDCIDFINKNYKEYKRYFIFRSYEDTNFKDKEFDFLFEFESYNWDGIAFKLVENSKKYEMISYYITDKKREKEYKLEFISSVEEFKYELNRYFIDSLS